LALRLAALFGKRPLRLPLPPTCRLSPAAPAAGDSPSSARRRPPWFGLERVWGRAKGASGCLGRASGGIQGEWGSLPPGPTGVGRSADDGGWGGDLVGGNTPTGVVAASSRAPSGCVGGSCGAFGAWVPCRSASFLPSETLHALMRLRRRRFGSLSGERCGVGCGLNGDAQREMRLTDLLHDVSLN